MRINSNFASCNYTHPLKAKGYINNTDSNSNTLVQKFQNISNKQGIIGKGWDFIKKNLHFGISSNDCKKALYKYENGKLSLNELNQIISNYDQKQKNATELISNIITGVASIAVATKAVKCGNIGWLKAIAKGAPIGALVKTGIKTVDRATNNIKGDAFDSNEIIRDAVNGAVTGMTSAVSSNVGEGIRKGSLKLAVKNGTISGIACGAVSGGTSYITDVALNEDKKFNIGEFSKNVATSAFVSGTVGGVVGAGLYGISASSGSVGANAVQCNDVLKTTAKDSAASTSRKLLNRAERDLMTFKA